MLIPLFDIPFQVKHDIIGQNNVCVCVYMCVYIYKHIILYIYIFLFLQNSLKGD